MTGTELSPATLLGPLNDIERKHAPTALYTAGDTAILNHGARVAIVGSRKASADGLARARKLARILAERGDVVVSGLAMGIDTVAHEATIEASGKTIAVLGTPLDDVSPRENASLQDRIMREHLAISQFPSGRSTQRGDFPLRNRTMALVADVTVIVEAGEGSGTIHQAWEAIRLGRGLFVAKSVTDDQSLSWPKDLLRYGAEVLSDETLELFFEYLPPRRAARDEDAVLPF